MSGEGIIFSPTITRAKLLRQLMAQVGITSLKQLRQLSGISHRQLQRFRQGEIMEMPLESVVQLSETLQVDLTQLVEMFSRQSLSAPKDSLMPYYLILKQEYKHREELLAQEQKNVAQRWQNSSLQILESWLLQWPTAAYAAQQNPDLSAIKLLPLVKPVEKLLEKWGITAIGSVAEELPYDPQWHQLMSGTAQPGDRVKIRYVGYKQGDKLLHRAKVSPC